MESGGVESKLQAVDALLKSQKVFDSIRALLKSDRESKAGDHADMADLLSAVARRVGSGASGVVAGKRYLHVKANGGKAFLDALPESKEHQELATLQLVVEFRGHRFRGQTVVAEVEPKLLDSFMLPLQSTTDRSPLLALDQILKISDPVNLRLLREDSHGRVSVLSTHALEWRRVLVHGRLSIPLELSGGEDMKAPVGLLNLDLEILPLKHPEAPKELAVFIEQSDVLKQLNAEQAKIQRTDTNFHSYVKAWWQDYQRIRDTHQLRLIKLFASTPTGAKQFVCRFVTPIRAERCLDSSLHAARFVKLIPFEKEVKLGGEKTEVWWPAHAFLAKRFGDAEDHATLLCSLLLGFGLDAYVCVGTNDHGTHTWVLTRTGDNSVTLWEPLTGQRFPIDGNVSEAAGAESKRSSALVALAAALPFKKAWAVFNDHQFFANAQDEDSVLQCSWKFENKQHWKAMSESAISVLPRKPAYVLSPPTIDAAQEELRIERHLQELIEQYRLRAYKDGTEWDAELAFVLSPALAAYESERVTGVAFGNDEFQQAIKKHVPVNFVFKGVPQQFAHRDCARMLLTMLGGGSGGQAAAAAGGGKQQRKPSAVEDLLASRGGELRFALRARVVPYPENFAAVWVMLACTHRDGSGGGGVGGGAGAAGVDPEIALYAAARASAPRA